MTVPWNVFFPGLNKSSSSKGRSLYHIVKSDEQHSRLMMPKT